MHIKFKVMNCVEWRIASRKIAVHHCQVWVGLNIKIIYYRFIIYYWLIIKEIVLINLGELRFFDQNRHF